MRAAAFAALLLLTKPPSAVYVVLMALCFLFVDAMWVTKVALLVLMFNFGVLAMMMGLTDDRA